MDPADRIQQADVPSPNQEQPDQAEVQQLLEEYVLIPPNKDLPVGRAS